MIGDTRVGKSSILLRLMDDSFQEGHNVTIGVEFGNYVMKVNDKHVVQLQIWDTAGQESYRSITRIFYKGSHAVILVYDITNPASFENARDWKKEIENNADRDVLVYLVGNCADLEERREISKEEGIEMMQELELDHHMETSALTGDNIPLLFETITKHLYMENSGQLGEFKDQGEDKNRAASIGFQQQKDNDRINLYEQKPQKKKKKGCAC